MLFLSTLHQIIPNGPYRSRCRYTYDAFAFSRILIIVAIGGRTCDTCDPGIFFIYFVTIQTCKLEGHMTNFSRHWPKHTGFLNFCHSFYIEFT